MEPLSAGGWWFSCVEVSGANGQGETVQGAQLSWLAAGALILEDGEDHRLTGLPAEGMRESLLIS